jgi:signal transduction histidine kinase
MLRRVDYRRPGRTLGSVSRFSRPDLAAPVPTGHSASTPALRMMSLALHGLFFTLLAVLVVRGLVTGGLGVAWLLVAIVLGAVYALGGVVGRIRTDRRWAGCWLAVVLVLWSGLTMAHAEFSYLAFPLYFVLLHLLSVRLAVPALLGITGIVVAAQAQTAGGLTTAKVVGPMAGLAVAVLTASGYAALYRESRARARAVDIAMRMVEEVTQARSELAESQRTAGRLAERQRLAAEIHDTLAQGLSSIVLLARSAEAALPADPSAAAERLNELGQTAAENLAEARRFVRELTPPALVEASLSEALRRLAERKGADFLLEGEPCPLPVEAEVALLRLTQQALANAVQHAEATRIAVTLSYLDHEVTLDVFDDGVGFDPQAHRVGEQSGFGLHGMRERMAALGGQLTVESAPGEGTAVAAVIPLRPVDLPRSEGAGGSPASTVDGRGPTDAEGSMAPAPNSSTQWRRRGGRSALEVAESAIELPILEQLAAASKEPRGGSLGAALSRRRRAGRRGTGTAGAAAWPHTDGPGPGPGPGPGSGSATGQDRRDDHGGSGSGTDGSTDSHAGRDTFATHDGRDTYGEHGDHDGRDAQRKHGRRRARRLKPTPPLVARLTGRFAPGRRRRGTSFGQRSHS